MDLDRDGNWISSLRRGLDEARNEVSHEVSDLGQASAIAACLQEVAARPLSLTPEQAGRLSRELETGGKVLHAFGAEFVITALIALAAVARHRPDLEEPKEDHSEIDLEALAAKIAETSGGASGSLSEYMFAGTGKRPTIIIGLADTLVGIAEALFHDARVAWLIADLNKGTTRQYAKDGKRIVEVRARETLILPVWEDIVEFCQNMPIDACRKPLITIVRETPLNREILEEHLGHVVSPAGRAVQSLLQEWPELLTLNFLVTSGSTVFDPDELSKNVRTRRKNVAATILAGIRLDRGLGF
ncbi:MAG: hypothetical protein KC777_04350 [Cyanobacteria bacterium HKST-UBA02]|nr:hypothetical protein [Cyanobacteria bacterium HKST-UBA02]